MANFEDEFEDIFKNSGQFDDESKLTLRFCKACDKNESFEASADEYDSIIFKLFAYLAFFDKPETETYIARAISSAIKDFPDNIIFRLWKLRFFFHTNQIQEGVKYYGFIEENFTPTFELYDEMAVATYEFKLEGFDADHFARLALAMEPSVEMYLLRAKICLDKDDIDGAVEHFAEAYELNSVALDSIDRITIQRHSIDKGLDETVLQGYERRIVAVTDPNAEDLSNRLLSPTDLKFITRLTEEYPLEFEVWNSLGNAYMLKGDFEKAIESYQFAISIEQYPNAYTSLCQAYYAIQNFEKTIEYGKIINKTFEMISANVLIGSALRCQKKFSESLSYLVKADETDFCYPMILPEILSTLEESGRMDEIPVFFNEFYDRSNLDFNQINFLLDVFSDIKSLQSFKLLCRAAKDHFENDEHYCAWLVEVAVDRNLKGDFLPLDILEECADNPDTDGLIMHIGYFFAILYMLDGKPVEAENHLRNAIVIAEENIKKDFIDIDTRRLSTQYQNIFDIVMPYL